MTLNQHLNEVLAWSIANKHAESLAGKHIIPTLDLTLLDVNASIDALTTLDDKAKKYKVAAVCVYPEHLKGLKHPAPYQLATVINFPHGNDTLPSCFTAIEHCLQHGAEEIDYVFPYQHYLNEEKEYALNHCAHIIKACAKHNLTVKIILESGAFLNTETLYDLSLKLIDLGGNFLKTSTGKIEQGASLSAAFALLSAIKDSQADCGIKVSGGVKTVEQAQQYAGLAELIMGKKIAPNWFRIGASSLLDELLLSE